MKKRTICVLLYVLLCLICLYACDFGGNSNFGNNTSGTSNELSAQQVFSKVNPSVCFILSTDLSGEYFMSGSGFFIDSQGTAVTNYHVLEDAAASIIQTSDGQNYFIDKIIGASKDDDIIIFHADIEKSVPVTIGNSDKVVEGDTVYAIGYPYALQLGAESSTFTVGMVSKRAMILNGHTFIQATTQITHGNSGGVLINTKGEVVGITSRGITVDDVDYMNLSIPINRINTISRNINVSVYDFMRGQYPCYVTYYCDGTLSKVLGYKYGTIITPYSVSKIGYDFVGWLDKDTHKYDFSQPIKEDITVYAEFSIKQDLEYRVDYYQENASGTSFDLIESVNNTGEYKSFIQAEIKEYEHFVYNQARSKTKGQLVSEICMVLSVYYNREIYSVQVKNSVQGSSKEHQVAYGNILTLSESEQDGYDFDGWYIDDKKVSSALSYSFAVMNDNEIIVKYTPRKDTVYCVRYYQQNANDDEYSLIETKPMQGETDTLVQAERTEYPHFAINETLSKTEDYVSAKGNTVLSVYYDRINYDVSVAPNREDAGEIGGKSGQYRYETIIFFSAQSRDGFVFDGWYQNDVLVGTEKTITVTVESDIVIVAKWTAKNDIPYKVEYYCQKLGNNGYEKVDTVRTTGITNDTAFAEEKKYEHFTLNTEHSVVSGTVVASGDLVLKLYYDRNNYSLSVAKDEKAGTFGDVSGKYQYNEEITLSCTTNDGYTFLGWFVEDKSISVENPYVFFIEKDMAIEPIWTPHTDIPYSIVYYWENISDDEYSVHEKIDNTGTTDTLISAEIKEYDHFLFNETKSKTQGNVDADGKQVLSVYYEREEYTYEVSVNNEKGGTVVAENGNYKYGKEITVSVTTNKGYTYSGIYENDILVSDDMQYIFTISQDTYPEIRWEANTDVPYSVQYYFENVEDSNYSLLQTDPLTGTTDTQAIAEEKSFTHFVYEPTLGCNAGNIDGDGTRVLSMYYQRERYAFSTKLNNEKAGEIVAQNGSYKYGETITATANTNKGYVFDGWYDGKDSLSQNTVYEFTIDGNLVLIAKLSLIQYTVTYTYNGGKEVDNTLSYTVEDKDITLLDTEKDYYSFDGWYEGDKQITSVLTNSCRDIDLVAKWTSKIFLYQKDALVGITPYGRSLSTIDIGKMSTDITVKTIKYNVFNTNILKTVIVPDTVETIECGAFYGCYSLTSLTLPFVGNKKDIYENSNLGYIFGTTTYHASIAVLQNGKTYYLPSSLDTVCVTSCSTIWNGSFFSCNMISKIVLSDMVEEIKYGAFAGCSALEDIRLSSKVAIDGGVFEGCSSLKNIVLPDTMTNIPASLFCNCTGLTSITIPETVTEIGHDSFSGTGLTSITIPEAVTEIGDAAFSGAGLSGSISLSGNIQKIGVRAFMNCTDITSLEVGDKVMDIGEQAFKNCTNIQTVTLGKKVYGLTNEVFMNCTSLISITIKSSIKSVYDRAFYNCIHLQSLSLPSSVDCIGNEVLFGCSSLMFLEIPYADSYVFGDFFGTESYDNAQKTRQFYNNGSVFLTIDCYVPKSLQTVSVLQGEIPNRYFENCDLITHLNLGKDISKIEPTAGCTELTTLTVAEGNTKYRSHNNCIIEQTTNTLIFGCKGSIFPNDGSITSIGYRAFYENVGIEGKLVLPEGILSIGVAAFCRCKNITEIIMPNSIVDIGEGSFAGCENLLSVSLGENMKTIGNGAFSSCKKLKDITLPDKIESIGSSVFRECGSLSSIVLPSSVKSIGEQAFYLCSGLKKVYYNGTSSERTQISIGSSNGNLTNATWYYYSDNEPTDGGNYWRYDTDGVTVLEW